MKRKIIPSTKPGAVFYQIGSHRLCNMQEFAFLWFNTLTLETKSVWDVDQTPSCRLHDVIINYVGMKRVYAMRDYPSIGVLNVMSEHIPDIMVYK